MVTRCFCSSYSRLSLHTCALAVSSGWLRRARWTAEGAKAWERAWALLIWTLTGPQWWRGKGTASPPMMLNASVKCVVELITMILHESSQLLLSVSREITGKCWTNRSLVCVNIQESGIVQMCICDYLIPDLRACTGLPRVTLKKIEVLSRFVFLCNMPSDCFSKMKIDPWIIDFHIKYKIKLNFSLWVWW